MPKDLERDLGLYATITISIGAMIGSGIFVLPGLAADIAGPAVILAYPLAGLIVLPAALSKAEMATAMPESGGTYLFIDRAMGPLPGTIAGIGAWFTLIFKSAFALVGLGAYLLVFAPIPTKPVALGLGVLLLVVNLVGVKQTGRLQAAIVSVVLLALLGFIGTGAINVDSVNYHPFFEFGAGGVLAAAGFVFVSYAGVTKIASVAEEVENPGRNIPIAIIGSVLLMMVVYTLVVYVTAGVVSLSGLENPLVPMAVAAEQFLGTPGRVGMAAVAVIALVSMANAGILSSSRYPLAMSRDALAPPTFSGISERFNTPIYAITFTGTGLLVLIVFVPVVSLAKLASAFQILVFVFINGALVAFRESGLTSYDPEYVAPGYPWVQLFGIFGGILLLTQMGWVPLAGAVGIVVGGVGWYRFYGRERTEREGAALDAIRGSIGAQALAQTEQAVTDARGNVLVAINPSTFPERERMLLTLAGHFAANRGGDVHAVLFEEVPEQVSLSSAAATETETDRTFEAQTKELADTLSTSIEVSEIVSHDARRAVVNYAEDIDAALLLGETSSGRFHDELLGYDIDWFMEFAPCDVAFVRDRGLDGMSEIAVLAQRGPHGPLKVAVAGAVATEIDATVRFVTVVEEDASTQQVRSAEEYHAELEALCDAETISTVVQSEDLIMGLTDSTADADIAIVGHDPHTVFHDFLLGDLSNEIADELHCTVMLVHSKISGSFIRRLMKRAVF